MGVFVRDIKGLLESVSVDNRGAFERFYNLYYDQVFRFAYYCLGEKEACREVVTDVFFSVWQSRKRLKDIDNIDTYLYISVRNESFRFQARNKDLNRVSLNELLPLMEEEDEGSPEEHLELKEMREMLDKAIDELPEKCRLVFLMSREEGLKTKEIAEILSVQERQGFEPTTLTAYISATLLSKFQIGNETVTIFRCWVCPTLTAVCLPNFRVQRYGFLLKLANI